MVMAGVTSTWRAIARQFGCPVSDSKDVRSLRVWKMA